MLTLYIVRELHQPRNSLFFCHKTVMYHKDCLQISTHSRENTVTFHMLLFIFPKVQYQLLAQHSFIIS